MSELKISVQEHKQREDDLKWRSWGVRQNPFPESGVGHGVAYTAHLTEGQVEAINEWLDHALDHTQKQWRPLALKGSIGVGKTHWLQSIEALVNTFATDHGLEENIHISRHVLTGAGMRPLSLGALLQEGLSRSGLITRCLINYHQSATDADIGTASPLHTPLLKIKTASADEVHELIALFDSWLQRSRLPPAKLARLGIHERLEPEGQWIRAQAHICRLAAQVSAFQAWIVLIDQLEDLWRRDVTTPTRRARFLSDLRMLIDEAYEGAPIAVAMAWNTAAPGDSSTPPDVERQLSKDYQALFSRIHGDRVIEFPRLPIEHALPFARAYVDHVKREDRDLDARDKLVRRLESDLNTLIKEAKGDREIVPRIWLQVLHRWAETLPAEPVPDGPFKIRVPAKPRG